jgi:WD40 repeat protein
MRVVSSLALVLAQANVPFVKLEGYTHYVLSMAFSPEGKTIAASASNRIQLWDVSTGKPRVCLNSRERDV